MKVKIGEYELLESVTVIQFDGKDILFDIEDDIEGDIHFTLSFINDNKDQNGYTQIIALDKFNAKILISNVSYGGNSNIINLGTYKYKYDLSLNFRVINIIGDSKTLVFNFYIRKKEE